MNSLVNITKTSQDDVRAELAGIAGRLINIGFGPNRLSEEHAKRLALAAWVMDADPWAGEIHITPRGEIIDGYPLWIRRAHEYLVSQGDRQPNLLITYEELDQENDIAFLVRVQTASDKGRVIVERGKLYTTLVNGGMEPATAYDIARQEITGNIFEGVGIVSAKEDFGESKRGYERYPREERAKKRGLKAALKKMIPGLMRLRETTLGEEDIVIAPREVPRNNQTPKQIVADLGYEVDEEPLPFDEPPGINAAKLADVVAKGYIQPLKIARYIIDGSEYLLENPDAVALWAEKYSQTDNTLSDDKRINATDNYFFNLRDNPASGQ